MIKPMIKQALDSIVEVINFARLNNLTDTQEFINFEDELNKLSNLDHNAYKPL